MGGNMLILKILSMLCLCCLTTFVYAEENYEPNNDADSATWFYINDFPQKHKFDYQGDEDWFLFFAVKGLPFTIKIDDASVGNGINPSIEVYNTDGLLEREHNIGFIGEGEESYWSGGVPFTGYYFLRVHNVEPVFSADSNYTLSIFIPEGPGNGVIQGIVKDQCTSKSIAKAQVRSLLIEADVRTDYIIDQSFSYQSGDYGLVLDPGSYQVEVFFPGYHRKSKDVEVLEFDTIPLSFELEPEQGCNPGGQAIDIETLKNESAGFFDESTLQLELKEVNVSENFFSVQLQLLNDGNLQLLSAQSVPSPTLKNPALYDFQTQIVEVPQVFAFNKFFSLKLVKQSDDWVFGINELLELDINK